MMRRLYGAMFLIGLLAVAVPSADAAAAVTHHLTKIKSPRADHVVGIHGRVDAAVKSSVPLSRLRIAVNGRNITRRFHGSSGTYRAKLRLGRGMRPGSNLLTVQTKDYKDFDHVEFIVARPAPQLLKLTDINVDEPGAPVRAEVRVRPGATLRAWMNGHRVDHAFQPQGKRFVGRLGANDWVREGRNKLEVLVYREGRRGRSAVHDVASTSFRIDGVIAGAGRDRVISAGDFIELRASAAGTRDDVDYDWEVVDTPEDAEAPLLEHANTATPEFLAKTPGRYRVRATIRGGSASGAAHAAAAADTTSTDTVTVTVRPDVPPIGWRLLLGFSSRSGITLNGATVPGTERCSAAADPRCDPGYPKISYAIYDRQTLLREKSGVLYFDGDDPAKLADLAATYKRDPTYLMIVHSTITKADDPSWGRLLDTLGVAKSTPAREKTNYGPVSIVGVPGSPPGSAFISAPVCDRSCTGLREDAARMAGFLRLNPNSTQGGEFEFIRNDQTEFNTAASAPAGQAKMTLGRATATGNIPANGAGFFMSTWNSRTLALVGQDVFVTNGLDATANAAARARLADALTAATEGANSDGATLVMLQSFGRPSGNDDSWFRAGQAIGKLGGNAQVFTWLNQGTPDEPHQGGYALVGRAGMIGTPAAESSQSLTGKQLDGTLHGLLGRARDEQYQPLAADPTGNINFDLVNIVNRPTASNGGFPTWTPGEAAAAEFLGKDVMRLCLSNAPTCDVRKAYYQRISGTDWNGILANLGEVAKSACGRAAQPGAKFTPEDCEKVRSQLQLEVGARNQVAAYFGPNGLQEPFGNATVGALISIAAISDEIQKAVDPKPADNTASNALNVVSFLVKIAGAAGGLVNPAIGTAATGIAAGFGLAAYMTKHDGSPDLIGPELKVRAIALGGELADRYKRASAYFTTEAQIIMSDWTKMSYVAEHSAGDERWRIDDNRPISAQVDLATKQAVWTSMLQAAFPVIYDLGTGINNAKDWICRSDNLLLYDKKLFQKTGPGLQMRWIVPPAKAGGAWPTHLMAVGGAHTASSLHSAHLPAPTDETLDKVFRDPKALTPGGIGLYKLSLFAPPTFRVFPQVFQQTAPAGNPYGYYTCQDMPNPPGNAA